MTPLEIYQLAQGAGLPADRAKIAVGIAMAESSGRETQVTDDSDDLSYGLWQINMIGSLGPARRAQFGLKSNNALLDPKVNARVMSEISKNGQNFSAWTTYTSGKYKQYLPTGTDTITDAVTDPLSDAYDRATGRIDTAITALEKLTTWVSDSRNWIRVGYVVGGSLVVIIGLVQLLKPAAAPVIRSGKSATKIVKGVTSAGK